jgi:hypothetical protein
VRKRNISGRNKKLYTGRRPVLNRHNKLISRDFSAIEDDDHSFWLIQELANNAGSYAAAEAKARGLGTAYVRGNKLVRVSAKGEAVAIAPRLNRASYYVKYKPATILHAVEK